VKLIARVQEGQRGEKKGRGEDSCNQLLELERVVGDYHPFRAPGEGEEGFDGFLFD